MYGYVYPGYVPHKGNQHSKELSAKHFETVSGMIFSKSHHSNPNPENGQIISNDYNRKQSENNLSFYFLNKLSMPLDMPQDMHHPEYKEQPKEPNKSEIVEVVNHTQRDLVDFLNNGPLKERGITAERGEDGSVIISGMLESGAETAETQQKDIETQKQEIKDSLQQEIQSISQEADPAEKQNMINRVLQKVSNLVDYVADSLGPAKAHAGGVDLDAVMKKQEKKIEKENKKQRELDKETEQLNEETEQLNEETEQLNEETEQLNEETEQLNEETEQLNEETEQLNEETEQLKKEIAQQNKKQKELDKEIAESEENIAESKENISQGKEFIKILEFLEENVLLKGELEDSTKQEAEEKISRAETLMEEMDLFESQKEQINSILRVSKRKIN